MNKFVRIDTQTYNIGLGITSRCNATCQHCYSYSIGRNEDLSFEIIQKLLSNIQIKKINIGTGEAGLHPNFDKIIEYLLTHVPEVSITSNGLTLARMTNEQLCRLHDVDISLDFPNADKHNEFRGVKLFDLAVNQTERCKKLRVRCSVATAVTSSNIRYLLDMLKFVRKHDIALRLNLYKQTGSEHLTPTYEEFWEVFKIFLKEAQIVSCSEPILRIVLGMHNGELEGSPCAYNSLRIRPTGQINGCVYLLGEENLYSLGEEKIAEALNNIKHPRHIPSICQDCEYVKFCQGGCESRRLLSTGTEMPDMYCPYLRGDNIHIEPTIAKTDDPDDYIHSFYLCTLIVK